MKNIYIKLLAIFLVPAYLPVENNLQAKPFHKQTINELRIVYDSNQVIIPGKYIMIGIEADVQDKKTKKT